MPLNASQLAHKVDDLRGLHEHTGHWDYRTRIRKIINGGSQGVSALLGSNSENYNEDLPIPNMIESGLEHLAQKLGRVPDLKVDPYNNKDSERAKLKSEKIERIVHSYDKKSRIEM